MIKHHHHHRVWSLMMMRRNLQWPWSNNKTLVLINSNRKAASHEIFVGHSVDLPKFLNHKIQVTKHHHRHHRHLSELNIDEEELAMLWSLPPLITHQIICSRRKQVLMKHSGSTLSIYRTSESTSWSSSATTRLHQSLRPTYIPDLPFLTLDFFLLLPMQPNLHVCDIK